MSPWGALVLRLWLIVAVCEGWRILSCLQVYFVLQSRCVGCGGELGMLYLKYRSGNGNGVEGFQLVSAFNKRICRWNSLWNVPSLNLQNIVFKLTIPALSVALMQRWKLRIRMSPGNLNGPTVPAKSTALLLRNWETPCSGFCSVTVDLKSWLL